MVVVVVVVVVVVCVCVWGGGRGFGRLLNSHGFNPVLILCTFTFSTKKCGDEHPLSTTVLSHFQNFPYTTP